MAFPSVASVKLTGYQATSVTTCPVAMPDETCNVGDLLMVFFGSGSNNPGGAPSGWTAKYTGSSGVTGNPGIYGKVSDGTESSTTVNFTQGSGGWFEAQCIRIAAANWYGDLAGVEVSSQTNGTNSSPNPASLAPSWGALDTLWFEVLAMTHIFSTDRTVSSWSTNYTGSGTPADIGNGSDFGQCFVDHATRQLNASSDDPGTITLSGAINAWKTITVGVRPAAPVSTTRLLGSLGVGT